MLIDIDNLRSVLIASSFPLATATFVVIIAIRKEINRISGDTPLIDRLVEEQTTHASVIQQKHGIMAPASALGTTVPTAADKAPSLASCSNSVAATENSITTDVRDSILQDNYSLASKAREFIAVS
jgi:hypothetical protein